jgi:hypothetical protein
MSSMFFFAVTSSAIFHRARTQEGQLATTSLLRCGAWAMCVARAVAGGPREDERLLSGPCLRRGQPYVVMQKDPLKLLLWETPPEDRWWAPDPHSHARARLTRKWIAQGVVPRADGQLPPDSRRRVDPAAGRGAAASPGAQACACE